jgi:DNA ligase 1
MFDFIFSSTFCKVGKKWSNDHLAARLEESTNIMKSVYRSVFPQMAQCFAPKTYPSSSELPSYDQVIPALLDIGIDKLRDTCKLTPGVPLKPMLAKPTKAIGEVLDRFENKRFTCEYKYDGERAQVCYLLNCYLNSPLFSNCYIRSIN